MSIDRILEIVLSLVAVFTAIVFHEVSHGHVALRLGDPTAKNLGRLTLNPIAHVDPVGTILVPLVLAILRAPLFGWAKPVPINPMNFRNPFRGMMLVALAGPSTNVVMALGAAALGRLLLLLVPSSGGPVVGSLAGNLVNAWFTFLAYLVIYNLFLAGFNLLPIPPLDGSRVLSYFLPAGGRRLMLQLERYGFLIVAGLLYLGVFNGVFRLVWSVGQNLLGTRWLVLAFL
jgi:Zn-dependent protease